METLLWKLSRPGIHAPAGPRTDRLWTRASSAWIPDRDFVSHCEVLLSNLLFRSCLSSFSVQLHVQLLTDLIFEGRPSESILAANDESSAIAYSAVKALIRANVTLTGTGWFPSLRLGPLPLPDDCFSHSTSDSRSSCDALVCLNNKFIVSLL